MVQAYAGNDATVEVLVKADASIEAADTKGRTALTHASAENHPSVCTLLLDRGALVDAIDIHGATVRDAIFSLPALCRSCRQLLPTNSNYVCWPHNASFIDATSSVTAQSFPRYRVAPRARVRVSCLLDSVIDVLVKCNIDPACKPRIAFRMWCGARVLNVSCCAS
jgi:ankyrin repeat protein